MSSLRLFQKYVINSFSDKDILNVNLNLSISIFFLYGFRPSPSSISILESVPYHARADKRPAFIR